MPLCKSLFRPYISTGNRKLTLAIFAASTGKPAIEDMLKIVLFSGQFSNVSPVRPDKVLLGDNWKSGHMIDDVINQPGAGEQKDQLKREFIAISGSFSDTAARDLM